MSLEAKASSKIKDAYASWSGQIGWGDKGLLKRAAMLAFVIGALGSNAPIDIKEQTVIDELEKDSK